ncbi:hypothetical protein ACFT8W_13150 [Streptomyces hygroscopicus]|uniref:hypothetical protein n=1 Tax=Streptomyces hygroscopicus TaxID=1912 RepID=UPI0036457F7C
MHIHELAGGRLLLKRIDKTLSLKANEASCWGGTSSWELWQPPGAFDYPVRNLGKLMDTLNRR